MHESRLKWGQLDVEKCVTEIEGKKKGGGVSETGVVMYIACWRSRVSRVCGSCYIEMAARARYDLDRNVVYARQRRFGGNQWYALWNSRPCLRDGMCALKDTRLGWGWCRRTMPNSIEVWWLHTVADSPVGANTSLDGYTSFAYWFVLWYSRSAVGAVCQEKRTKCWSRREGGCHCDIDWMPPNLKSLGERR